MSPTSYQAAPPRVSDIPELRERSQAPPNLSSTHENSCPDSRNALFWRPEPRDWGRAAYLFSVRVLAAMVCFALGCGANPSVKPPVQAEVHSAPVARMSPTLELLAKEISTR